MRRTAIVLALTLVVASFAPGALAKGHDDGPPGCSGLGHWVALYAQSGVDYLGDDSNMGQGWVKPMAHGNAEWLEMLFPDGGFPTGSYGANDFVHFMQNYGFGAVGWPIGEDVLPVFMSDAVAPCQTKRGQGNNH